MAGYTRQDTADNIADTKTIDAADLDAEFDAVEAAFNNSTGHTHDGTAAEGAPIEVTGPNQEYLSEAAQFRPKTDDTYDLGSATFQWKDLYVDGTANIDSLVADTADIDGGTIDNAVIGGTTPAAGSFTNVTASGTVDGATGSFTNVTVSGTVDGRDVSADGTKLDGIEAGADVTDTTNVTAAGALMDSELTNITAVKALDQGVATTDSPTFAAITVTGNVDGRDVSVDGTKLDTIETNADVTDTANVTAAGALMDSELTNIAAVKALDQGVATTDSPSFSQVYAGYGSAAAPSFAFNGDINTGLYRSAADELSISTGGVERMRIDSSGNVGIGTTSPSEQLSVNANVSAANFYVTSSGDTSTNNISGAFVHGGINSKSLVIQADPNNVGAATAMRFEVDGSERMRIDSSGDVGIGTSSPSSKLDVNGDVTITDKIIHSGDNTSIRFPANDTFTVETAGSERMRIDSSSVSVALNFIPDADGTRNLGADATRWNSSYHDYARVTNNIHTGDGFAASPAYAFEGDTNTGLYQRTGDELNISTGGSERLRVSAEPRAETSGSVTDTSLSVWNTFDTLAFKQFTAQSTSVLITGDVIFSAAGVAMYVYSRVKLIVTGGADFAVGSTQIDGLVTSAPFDYVSQSPSLSVTGLTPGGDYTVILEVAKGNAAACTAQGLVNYVHG